MSSPQQPACGHETFDVAAQVGRLTGPDGRVTDYIVDIKVACLNCGTPFTWRGVGRGVSLTSPAVSMDRTELRAPIEPATPAEARASLQTATRFWPPGRGQVIPEPGKQ